MKTTKVLVLSLVLCFAFTCLTAFADIGVTTITSYDYDAQDTDTMNVTATISGVAAGDMITYYVSDDNGIVFIDQKTAEGTSLTFEFDAKKGDVIGATAKNGSNKGYDFPQFTFVAGSNFLTQGKANANLVGSGVKVSDFSETIEGLDDVDENAYAFTCTLSGNATEYGVKLLVDGELQKYPAYGCNGEAKDGYATYVVILDGITDAQAKTVEAYAE